MSKKRRRHLRALPPLELPPMEDLDGFGFLDGFIDPELIKQAGYVAGGGAAAGLLYKAAILKLATGTPPVAFFDSAWKKALLAAAIGIGGGILLWGKPGATFPGSPRRNLALGALGAMGAQLGLDLVNTITKDSTGKGFLEGFGDVPLFAGGGSFAQLGETFVEERRSLMGGDEIDVSEHNEPSALSWLA